MSEEAFNSQRCDLCQILQKSSSPTLPSHLTFLFKWSRFTHINIIIAKLRNTTLKTLQRSSSLTLQPDGTSDALSVFRYLLLEEPNERYFQCWSCLDDEIMKHQEMCTMYRFISKNILPWQRGRSISLRSLPSIQLLLFLGSPGIWIKSWFDLSAHVNIYDIKNYVLGLQAQWSSFQDAKINIIWKVSPYVVVQQSHFGGCVGSLPPPGV